MPIRTETDRVASAMRGISGERMLELRTRSTKLADLVLELAEAVDHAAEDIGGARPQLTILREAVAEAQRIKAASR